MPETTAAPLDRRFEAILFPWDAGSAFDGAADPAAVRALIERSCAAGLHIGVISASSLDDVDGQLGARPSGPGRLAFATGSGAQLTEVGADGPRLVVLADHPARTGDDATGDGDATRSLFEWLRSYGVGAGLALVLDHAPVAPDGRNGRSAYEPSGTPRLGEHLADQLERRRRGDVPDVDEDPGWALVVEGVDPERERARAALLTLADGSLGTTGCPVLNSPSSTPHVLATNVYDGSGPEIQLLECPVWYRFPGDLADNAPLRRVLDLRTGLLHESIDDDEPYRSLRFSSLARPGTVAMRIDNAGFAPNGLRMLEPPAGPAVVDETVGPDEHSLSVLASEGGIAVSARGRKTDAPSGRGRERIVAFAPQPSGPPSLEVARSRAEEATNAGFDRLLAEQREAWAARWADADVVIESERDADLQLKVRFALHHLLAAAGTEGEAAVGARGLTGAGYRGHVFWDTDVFVLPALAATNPAAARAILEYRIRRLPDARAAAVEEGAAGARFPWESARTGRDVTPTAARDRTGHVIPIRTGKLEVHIVACVAWAASTYVDWTGDDVFAAGPGRELLVETARYWASRIRADEHGHGHIYGVIGPDEYHEPVDDNAFTNVMARWNLRRAATVSARRGRPSVPKSERDAWLAMADSIVDGYDTATGIYEQFAGFSRLDPLIVAEFAPRRPLAADLLFGPKLVRGAQIVKQADVLMLHHLVPNEVVPGSLVPNLDYYEPRTAHGSSLSPAVHAAVFARAGRLDEAVEALRIAADIDLLDLTDTSSGGLHMATLGGVWQALVYGFAGIRPNSDGLTIDPRLPERWDALDLRVRFRGSRVRVRVEHERVQVFADPSLTVVLVGVRGVANDEGLTLYRKRETWEVSR